MFSLWTFVHLLCGFFLHMNSNKIFWYCAKCFIFVQDYGDGSIINFIWTTTHKRLLELIIAQTEGINIYIFFYQPISISIFIFTKTKRDVWDWNYITNKHVLYVL